VLTRSTHRVYALAIGALVLAYGLFAYLSWALPASAQTLPEDAPVGATLTLSDTGVRLIIGLVLPIVLGLIVKASNPEWVKVIGGIVVAAIAALITDNLQDNGTAVLSWDMFVGAVLIYVPQVVSYLGIWKPLDLNNRLAPDKGLIPIERQAA
jgi:hypothetical protein